MNGPASEQLVGVVGAGTMGAGIAQVAAAAGHPVLLLDARPGAAAAARTQIASGLTVQVNKGRLDESARSALLARISAVDALSDLAAAVIVIEVIVEDITAKQGLLREPRTRRRATVRRRACLADLTPSGGNWPMEVATTLL